MPIGYHQHSQTCSVTVTKRIQVQSERGGLYWQVKLYVYIFGIWERPKVAFVARWSLFTCNLYLQVIYIAFWLHDSEVVFVDRLSLFTGGI